MDKNKVVTYALLAHINNTTTFSTGLLDIFVPIAKKAISELNKRGVERGGSIIEIQNVVNELYGLDVPVPILKKLLVKIQKEVNTDSVTRFILYSDGAYAVHDYNFDDYEEVISKKELEISHLEDLFQKFCEVHKITKNEYSSIFDFINRNKLSIARYLDDRAEKISESQTSLLIEAKFTDYFRNVPEVYNTIRSIYLGSVISTYIEFKTEEVKLNVELLYDTNFVVGLLDLNTPESSHTCNKLVDLAKGLGFKQSIMETTITEIQSLLKARAENFESAYLVRRVNREDIYNACDRKGLNKTDLQRIADNIEDFLISKNIFKVPNTEKYRNLAKFSREFESLKLYRSSDFSALHDASAIYYVREKRGKRIFAFEDVNCWFVHNSTSTVTDPNFQNEGKGSKPLPESIKVDDLLNILWLTNPGFAQTLNSTELTNFGLNALISCTLSDALPKASLIRDLDSNISKYVADSTLNEQDIIRLGTRISNRELTDIDELNNLEKRAPNEFIKKVKQASEAQKAQEEERAKRIDNLFAEITESSKSLKQQQEDLILERDKFTVAREEAANIVAKSEAEKAELRNQLQKNQSHTLRLENEIRQEKRKKFINGKIKRWRLLGWIEVSVCLCIFTSVIVYFLYKNDWSLEQASVQIGKAKENIIFSGLLFIGGLFVNGVSIKSLVDKYRNHSNIKAFKEGIEIPKDLIEVISLNEK